MMVDYGFTFHPISVFHEGGFQETVRNVGRLKTRTGSTRTHPMTGVSEVVPQARRKCSQKLIAQKFAMLSVQHE
jgi:hypothetical protein